MGKIKKILENELVGGTQSTDVYPVTSVKAVYDEENERLDHILSRRGGVVNISTNYNDDHIAEVLTLSQAIAKVPSKDRMLGFQGNILTSNGWTTYKFIGTDITQWGDTSYWALVADSSNIAQEFGNREDIAASQKLVYSLIGWDSMPYIDGIFISHSGSVVENSDWESTDYMVVSNFAFGRMKIPSNYSVLHISFYDINKSFISGYQGNNSTMEFDVDIPSNAVYFRLSKNKGGVYEGEFYRVAYENREIESKIYHISDLEKRYILTEIQGFSGGESVTEESEGGWYNYDRDINAKPYTGAGTSYRVKADGNTRIYFECSVAGQPQRYRTIAIFDPNNNCILQKSIKGIYELIIFNGYTAIITADRIEINSSKIEDVSSKIEDVSSKTYLTVDGDTEEINPTLNTGYYIDRQGNIQNGGNFYYSDPILLNKGSILVVKVGRTNYSVPTLFQTDNNGSYYKPIYFSSNQIAPNNIGIYFYYFNVEDSYIALSGFTASLQEVKVHKYYNGLLNVLYGHEEVIRGLNTYSVVGKERDIHSIKTGYYQTIRGIAGGGTFPGFQLCVYKVTPGEKVFIGYKCRGSVIAAGFYDDGNLTNLISYVNSNPQNTEFNYSDVVIVPEGAEYLATTQNTTEGETFKLKAYLVESVTLTNKLDSINEELNSINEKLNKADKKTIVSWGDSLTAGAGGGGTTYSNVLQTLLGENYQVLNAGVGGETTYTIAARQGGEPMCLGNEVTIPATKTAVTVNLTNYLGKTISPLKQGGDDNVNPCYIDGIAGTLTQSNNVYSFTRSEEGESRTVNANTPIITNYMRTQRTPYAMIIWIGTNGQYDSTEDLINQYKKMISYSGNNNYVIIGMHYVTSTYTVNVRKEQEGAFRREFGTHFLNWREYLATHAIYDAGLGPTEEDLQAMEEGKCPPTFLTDSVHLNATAYTLLAKQIYNILSNLGCV